MWCLFSLVGYVFSMKFYLTETVGNLKKGTVFTLKNGVFENGNMTLLVDNVICSPHFEKIEVEKRQNFVKFIKL